MFWLHFSITYLLMLTFNRNLSDWAASVNSPRRVSSRECSSWYDIPTNTASQNLPWYKTLMFQSDFLSHLVQRFFGVHQPRDDPIQPIQSSWPVTSVRLDGMWPQSRSSYWCKSKVSWWCVCACADQRKWGGVGSPSFIYPVWAAPVGGGGSQVHTVHVKRQNCGAVIFCEGNWGFKWFVCFVADGTESQSVLSWFFLHPAVPQKWSTGWRTSGWPSTWQNSASAQTLTFCQTAFLETVSPFTM